MTRWAVWGSARRWGERKREYLALNGLLYPVWYMVIGDIAMVAAVVGAIAVRHSFVPPSWPLLVGLVALVPDIWFYLFGVPPRMSFITGLMIHTGVVFTASALLLLRPAAVTPDIAPLMMCLPIAFVAATIRARASFAAVLVAAIIVNVAYLRHTLTGARRGLQRDRDVDDAVVALSDAERVGRQAMSDIRRTVGLLGGGSSQAIAESGLADVADLVADFVAAGLRVKLAVHGDIETPSPAVGLSLYRIIQESLTNVVKHASGATAEVDLSIADEAAVTLSIRNDFAGAVPMERGVGSGLRGMRQRAEALGGTLFAGPQNRMWVVNVEIPIESEMT